MQSWPRREVRATSFDSETSVDRGIKSGEEVTPIDRDRDAPGLVEDLPTTRMLRTWLVGNRYELGEQMSAGGMGQVYRAIHRDLGRPFALKLMLENQRGENDLRERFYVEARLASSLAHPNIVSVTDYGLDDRHGCYIVMELLEGSTVRARLLEGQMASRLAFDVVDQLTGAVRYMHARGIVHGDIKPENVFLTRVEGEPRRANVVKLLDFGLSFRTGSAPERSLGGTPPYLAPERLKGAPPSPACDVYSIGALLYEMLTGKTPYLGTLTEMIDRSLLGPRPRPPSSYQHGLDGRVDALVMRALERDPARRHPSAEAFHFELRTIMSMNGLKVRRGDKHAPSGPAERRAVDAALSAAERGDLEEVQRILSRAQRRINDSGEVNSVQDALVDLDDVEVEDA